VHRNTAALASWRHIKNTFTRTYTCLRAQIRRVNHYVCMAHVLVLSTDSCSWEEATRARLGGQPGHVLPPFLSLVLRQSPSVRDSAIQRDSVGQESCVIRCEGSVCMYVLMYVCMYVCMRSYPVQNIFSYMSANMHFHAQERMQTSIYMLMNDCKHAFPCLRMDTNKHLHAGR
jgi:hypothetical protein